MWTVALSQLRSQPRRYLSVVLAILIGTMFLAASFLVSASAQATLRATLGSTYSGADLVVLPDSDAPSGVDAATADSSPDAAFPRLAGSPDAPGSLGRVPGVAEAYAPQFVWLGVAPSADGGDVFARGDLFNATLVPVPRDVTLLPVSLTAGAMPAPGDADGITLDAATAEREGLAVGDAVTLSGGQTSAQVPARVVGLTTSSPDPMLSSGGQLWAAGPVLEAVRAPAEGATADETAVQAFSAHVLLRLTDGADRAAVTAEVSRVLEAEGVAAQVTTPDAAARESLADASGGTDVFGWILGGFAVLALLVTALVIANTFQVLVAQRTRDLALLRTLGSTAGQVRTSVLLEALVVGAVGSVLGVAFAVGGTAALVGILRPALDVPTLTFGLDPAGLALTVLVGVVVTLAAAFAPARAATRVTPLQALRPQEEVTAGSRAGVVRTVLGVVLAAGGTVLMLRGAFAPEPLSAIGGGVLSFLGVLLLASLFVPAAVRGAAVLARPVGVPGRLAGLNATRHRSRTAATASALLIGTTLVALFLTGGRTAQDQTGLALDSAYPVDLVVSLPVGEADATATGGDAAAVAPSMDAARATADRVRAVDGVAAVALASPAGRTVNGSTVFAADGAALRDAVELPADVEGRLGEPGTVFVPDWVEEDVQATVDGREQTLSPVRGGSLNSGVYLADASLRSAGWDGMPTELDGEAGGEPRQLLVRLADGIGVSELSGLSESITEAAGSGAQIIDGGAPNRALYAQIIDAMLWIVVALLAVSVLIALIGVANTLSLSVIERTRENALLRALGLTRGGLRGMIAIESVLIAGVAALLGCALGVFYGWAGSQLILGDLVANVAGRSVVTPAVPWPELALVVAVAAVAGLAASLLPARRAANLSPVEGLSAV